MGKFKPNHAGIGEMLRSDFMRAEMLRRAEKAKAVAEAIAPFDADSKDGTHYKDAFRIESGSRGGYHHDRAYGRLINDDEAALWVEVGSKNNPAHHVLSRAIEAARE